MALLILEHQFSPQLNVHTNFTYTAFNFTAAVTLGGGSATGTVSSASLALSALPDISSNPAELTLIKVTKTVSGAIEEDVIFRTTTVLAEQGVALSGGAIGIYLNTSGTIDDFGSNLASAINSVSAFTSSYDATNDTVTIETADRGYLHNTDITYSSNMSAAITSPPSQLTGGTPKWSRLHRYV